MRRRRSCLGDSGQATLEYVLAYSGIVLPVTFGIVFTAQLLWVWHSVNDFTREGARYATTHCWQGSGDNVRAWMQQNAPLMFDRDQIRNGPAQIQITYYSRDVDTGSLVEFGCDQGECSTLCVPEVVTVTIVNYEFRTFVTSFLGLPPVTIPDFRTTLPIESAGCDPDTGECLP